MDKINEDEHLLITHHSRNFSVLYKSMETNTEINEKTTVVAVKN